MRAGRELESRARRLTDRSLGDLVGELGRQTQGLVRDEIALAKTELRDELARVEKAGVRMAAGGAVAYAALFLLGAALVLVGATFLPPWLSALVVTAIYAAAGWTLLARGREELRAARPSRAVEHFKEDGRWARETMHDIRSSRGASGSPRSRARYHDA